MNIFRHFHADSPHSNLSSECLNYCATSSSFLRSLETKIRLLPPEPNELKERSRMLMKELFLTALASIMAPFDLILFQWRSSVSSLTLFLMKRAKANAPTSVMRFFEALKSLREVMRPDVRSSGSSSASESRFFCLDLCFLGTFVGYGSGLSLRGSGSRRSASNSSWMLQFSTVRCVSDGKL